MAKEIEFQDLEIQAEEKKIKESKAQIEFISSKIEESKEFLVKKKDHFEHKSSKLDNIMAETKKEEEALMALSEKFSSNIEERLMKAYKKIRSNVRNGLAIVSIERGASAGSFFTIPPQTQVEIATRKKIIIDEHSGRLLIDNVLGKEEREKMQEIFENLCGRRAKKKLLASSNHDLEDDDDDRPRRRNVTDVGNRKFFTINRRARPTS